MTNAPTLQQIDSRFTTYIHVDLDDIAHNVRALAGSVPDAEVMAVVKDNAYGHGAVQVARAALQAGAAKLAVARTEEGIELRQAGITAPVLNLSYTLPAEADALVQHDITAALGDVEAARALSAAALRHGTRATLHIKVDTGMGRFGVLPEEALPFIEAVHALPALDVEGIYTHFATADEPDKTYTRQQFAQFEGVLRAARSAGYTFRVRHAANSAATIDLPETALDLVRPGIALYGLAPSPHVSDHLNLRPALSLHSHIARLRTLPRGSGVGYGLTYVTEHPTPIALVPVGYGDGYQRLLSNKACVLIGGRRVRLAGRVCMDSLMVDATAAVNGSTPQLGDPVTLIGRQGAESVTADELAAITGTINYEVVARLSRRIPRVFTRGGVVTEVIQYV